MSIALILATAFWCIAAEICWKVAPRDERDGLMLAVCFLLGPLALLIGFVAGTIDYFMGRK